MSAHTFIKPCSLQYGSVKAKTLCEINFFNVDVFAQRLVEKRLAAGYHRGAKNPERRKKCLTELYWCSLCHVLPELDRL